MKFLHLILISRSKICVSSILTKSFAFCNFSFIYDRLIQWFGACFPLLRVVHTTCSSTNNLISLPSTLLKIFRFHLVQLLLVVAIALRFISPFSPFSHSHVFHHFFFSTSSPFFIGTAPHQRSLLAFVRGLSTSVCTFLTTYHSTSTVSFDSNRHTVPVRSMHSAWREVLAMFTTLLLELSTTHRLEHFLLSSPSSAHFWSVIWKQYCRLLKLLKGKPLILSSFFNFCTWTWRDASKTYERIYAFCSFWKFCYQFLFLSSCLSTEQLTSTGGVIAATFFLRIARLIRFISFILSGSFRAETFLICFCLTLLLPGLALELQAVILQEIHVHKCECLKSVLMRLNDWKCFYYGLASIRGSISNSRRWQYPQLTSQKLFNQNLVCYITQFFFIVSGHTSNLNTF